MLVMKLLYAFICCLFWGLVISLNCLLVFVFCLVYLLCLFIYGCLTWLGYFVASLVFPVCLFVWYVTFVCFDLLFCCFCLVWIVVLLIDFGWSFRWLLIVLDYCLLFVVVWVWMICRLIVLPPSSSLLLNYLRWFVRLAYLDLDLVWLLWDGWCAGFEFGVFAGFVFVMWFWLCCWLY